MAAHRPWRVLPAGRKPATATAAAALVCALALPTLAHAHGELHVLIESITVKVAANPGNVALLLRRAELQRLHHAFEAADADYARALALAPGDDEARWMRARSRLEGGRPEAALEELDLFIAAHPAHASAFLTRARTRAKLEHYRDASSDYAEAIRLLPQPEPDVIVEWTRAQKLAGVDALTTKRTLDRVLARIGPVPAIEDAALALEIELREWDAALARLDRRASASQRQEQWQFRRGQVLRLARRDAEAADAFERCLHAIDALPPAIGQNAAMASLARNVKSELAKLGSDTNLNELRH